MSESSQPKRLPPNPSEAHLRKQAKRRTKQAVKTKLAQAQHQIAREYGCKSWSELMRSVASNQEISSSLWKLCASTKPAKQRLSLTLALLKNGARVLQACENQSTALHLAARHGPLEMVELLLTHGAKEWQTDKDGKKPVDYARAGNAADKEKIIELLDRPVIRDPVFKSAVQAIHTGDLQKLQLLLRDHPHLVHDRAIEPACYPPSYFSNPKLLWFVANNPILVETMPANLVQIANAIIELGADRDDLDITLELAMTGSSLRRQKLQIPLMQLLFARGANPGDLLAVLGHGELEPVRFLIQSGLPITAPIAAALGQTDQLLGLLTGADSTTRQIAFGIAVINRQAAAARLCLEAGADVNGFLPVHAHSTAVHQAAVNDDIEMLGLLAEFQARLDIRDTLWNATPLGWARHTSKQRAEEYLRSLGAT